MTAKALLNHEPNPSSERIKEAMSGNLCRCTGYQQIVESVETAAQEIREAGHKGPSPDARRSGS
jgi:carbon-monoxide dehydrogenase small subunit